MTTTKEDTSGGRNVEPASLGPILSQQKVSVATPENALDTPEISTPNGPTADGLAAYASGASDVSLGARKKKKKHKKKKESEEGRTVDPRATTKTISSTSQAARLTAQASGELFSGAVSVPNSISNLSSVPSSTRSGSREKSLTTRKSLTVVLSQAIQMSTSLALQGKTSLPVRSSGSFMLAAGAVVKEREREISYLWEVFFLVFSVTAVK